jgi:hypothetical protein
MHLLPTATLLFLFCGTACVSTTTPAHATVAADALLLEASSTHQGHVAEARRNRARAKDAHAAAVAATTQSRAEQTRDEGERDAALGTVTRAGNALEQARKSGTTSDVTMAQQELDRVELQHQERLRTAALSDRRTAHTAAVEAVAKEHLAVADAVVELAKARAVDSLDRPDRQKPDVATFEASLRTAEANEQLAQVRAEAMQKEVEAKRAEPVRTAPEGTR